MKNKTTLVIFATLVAGVVSSSAATVFISNASDGPGDTLYANNNNTLMNGGLVTAGYFAGSVTQGDLSTVSGLFANLGSFTPVTSIAPGAPSGTLGGSFAGYADQFPTATSIPGGLINSGNTLFNRDLYAIITSASSIGSATASSQYGLIYLGKLIGDSPVELAFTVNPKGANALIGTYGTITGDFAGDASEPSSQFGTFKMAVPEPSAALLGAIGALGLLRRRRN